jgi:actin-related protein
MIEIFIETFNCLGFYTNYQGFYCMRAANRKNGVALNIGHGVTTALAVEDGAVVPNSFCRADIGGQDVTDYMARLLTGRGHNTWTWSERQSVQQLKESLGYVALNLDAEMQSENSTGDVLYNRPNGNNISVSTERFRAPELLFKPQLNGCLAPAIDELLCSSIAKTSSKLQQTAWSDIVICGGSSQFKGLDDRLTQQLAPRAPPKATVKITRPKGAMHGAWKGAAQFANRREFRRCAITREQYQEEGRGIVHHRCV